MADEPRRQAATVTSASTYSQRDNRAFETWMSARAASDAAAFFLPYLRPGMRVLDVGCGPGSITLGLAKAVALAR